MNRAETLWGMGRSHNQRNRKIVPRAPSCDASHVTSRDRDELYVKLHPERFRITLGAIDAGGYICPRGLAASFELAAGPFSH